MNRVVVLFCFLLPCVSAITSKDARMIVKLSFPVVFPLLTHTNSCSWYCTEKDSMIDSMKGNKLR